MSGYDIGPRIGIQGEKEFNNQIKNINNNLKEYGSEMNALTAKFSENARGQEALIEKTKVLEKQYAAQKQKSSVLQEQYTKEVKKLKELSDALQQAKQENGENSQEAAKAEIAFNKQAEAVSKLKVSMNETEAYANKLENAIKQNETALSEMEAGTRDAVTGLSNLKEEADDTGEELAEIGKKIDKDLMMDVADTFSSFADSMIDAAEESKEFIKISGQLQASSEKLGYSADQTQESYKQLYGVLGDDQTTATTTANLQALGLEQDKLKQMTEGVIGAWAQYGDSIPIDGLAEAINETVKVGQVTGTFADVLNWAGTSEDEFNAKLQSCSNESERANLILEELANQGLMESAEAFRENNSALIENNEANAEFQQTMAEIGQQVLPVMTTVKEALTGVMQAFTALPEPVQNTVVVFGSVLAIGAKMAPMITAISTAMGAMGASGAASAAGTAAAGTAAGGAAVGVGALNASLLPIAGTIAAVVAAIALVIAAVQNWDEIVAWAKENIGPKLEAIGGFFDEMGENISETKNKAVEKVKEMKENFIQDFEEMKENVGNKMSDLHSVTEQKLQNIADAYESNGGGIKGIVAAWQQAVKEYFTAGYDYLNTLTGGKLDAIKEKFSTKLEAVRTKVSTAIEKIKSIFNKLNLKLPEIKIPKIKMPHFKITGKFSLNPPSTPKFSVEWYREGGILSGAQLFGMMGGKFLGGGEAGKEAVLPLDSFYRELRTIMFNAVQGAKMDYSGAVDMQLSPNISVYVGNKEFKSYIVDAAKDGINAINKAVNKAKGA